MPDPIDPSDLESYARAAARAAGLPIEDAWWPDVIRHLGGMLSRAAAIESVGIDLPEDPAPVFQP